ncbi:NADH dehydrogenase [ubiquinone] 1 alpha subcomplex subunit 10, mitochondrial isoform X2 [Cephus cinctus]|nr:NADH dehydrogenase [ubiquinone] 1 alpha subcomplex subunit 10, mitochondrial isoform X2 [Cephus cinctus]
MAWTVRTAVIKLPSSGFGILHKVTPNTKNIALMQAAFISTKYIRSLKPPPEHGCPKPYDYVNKRYGVFAQLFDRMMNRFHENSKIIVVDGTIASGKTEVAKTLANEFDMLYSPAPDEEDLYIHESGYDLRKLNHKLPESLQLIDVENFLKNPDHVNSGLFQINMYAARYMQYILALEHILNTGQGVVIERCPWGDTVFMDAMHKAGYVTTATLTSYREIMKNSLHYLMRPNLIVYLDAPVETVQQKIKQRGIPYEVNSKVLTKDYLQTIEKSTRINYLKSLSSHAEILIYDWSNGGDAGSIIEDIEQINFETERHDPKHADWKFDAVDSVRRRRVLYTNNKIELINALKVDEVWNPDLLITPEEDNKYRLVMDEMEEELRYQKGYNHLKGDKVLWKL